MIKQIVLLVTFAMAISFAANANPADRMIVRIEKTDAAKTIHLQLANLENKRTSISLFDANGTGWFSKTVTNQNGYGAKVDLNGLPYGDFVLIIERNGNKHVQAMSISENDIAFFNNPESVEQQTGVAVLTSNVSEEKGKLITHFNKEANQQATIQLANLLGQPASISLVSPIGGTMLSKNIKGEKGYYGKWDLAGMPTGVYFFYVNSADATVIQFLELKEEGVALMDSQRLERSIAADKPVLSAR